MDIPTANDLTIESLLILTASDPKAALYRRHSSVDGGGRLRGIADMAILNHASAAGITRLYGRSNQLPRMRDWVDKLGSITIAFRRGISERRCQLHEYLKTAFPNGVYTILTDASDRARKHKMLNSAAQSSRPRPSDVGRCLPMLRGSTEGIVTSAQSLCDDAFASRRSRRIDGF